MATDPNPADAQPKGTPNGDSFTKEGLEWWEKMLSPLSPEDRESVTSKFKGYDKGYKSLKADFDRRNQEMTDREQEIKKLVGDLKQAATKPPPEPVKGESRIQSWIKKAEAEGDYQTVYTLRAMDEMISEKVSASPGGSVEKIEQELKRLSEENKSLRGMVLGDKRTQFTSQLEGLKKSYGNELISKYEKQIMASHEEYPNLSPKRLLWNIATEDEVEQAQVINARKAGKEAAPASPTRRGSVTGSEERPLHEKFKGKTAGETSGRYRELVAEAMGRAMEKKRLEKAGV